MRWISLVGWIALCFAVGGIAGVWTASDVNGWYGTLVRPSIAPPDWVFGPVWTTLYLLMAIAAWRISEHPGSALRSWGIGLFLVQLALNFAWPWIFFRQHALGAGLVEILVLWTAIAATLWIFSRISPPSGWLMLPYLLWVSFATALNFEFWRWNR